MRAFAVLAICVAIVFAAGDKIFYLLIVSWGYSAVIASSFLFNVICII
jgi:hypothetical protein